MPIANIRAQYEYSVHVNGAYIAAMANKAKKQPIPRETSSVLASFALSEPSDESVLSDEPEFPFEPELPFESELLEELGEDVLLV